MPTLAQIKQSVANYLDLDLADLTLNGEDLFLTAANECRREAEQTNDFEFSRRLIQLTVDGVSGGDLGDAVLKSDGTTAVNVKTVIEVGQFDNAGNFRPVEWTTVAESLERQREDSREVWMPRYPNDSYFDQQVCGLARVVFSGDSVFMFPKDSSNDYTLGMEVYTYADDWASVGITEGSVTVTGTLAPDLTGTYVQVPGDNPIFVKFSGGVSTANGMLYRTSDETGWILAPFYTLGGGAIDIWQLTTSSESSAGTYTPVGGASGSAVVSAQSSVITDIWTTQGAQYLTWASIVRLNHRFKHFVFRQEGNLPPPEKLAEAGLLSLKQWDAHKFEQNRRHGR